MISPPKLNIFSPLIKNVTILLFFFFKYKLNNYKYLFDSLTVPEELDKHEKICDKGTRVYTLNPATSLTFKYKSFKKKLFNLKNTNNFLNIF